MFFWNLAIENFASGWHDMLAYPLMGGMAWLAVQAVGWVIEGFRGRAG